jgi:hypothetical protein
LYIIIGNNCNSDVGETDLTIVFITLYTTTELRHTDVMLTSNSKHPIAYQVHAQFNQCCPIAILQRIVRIHNSAFNYINCHARFSQSSVYTYVPSYNCHKRYRIFPAVDISSCDVHIDHLTLSGRRHPVIVRTRGSAVKLIISCDQ